MFAFTKTFGSNALRNVRADISGNSRLIANFAEGAKAKLFFVCLPVKKATVNQFFRVFPAAERNKNRRGNPHKNTVHVPRAVFMPFGNQQILDIATVISVVSLYPCRKRALELCEIEAIALRLVKRKSAEKVERIAQAEIANGPPRAIHVVVKTKVIPNRRTERKTARKATF